MRALILLAAMFAAESAAAADPVTIPVLAHAVVRGDILSVGDFETRPVQAAQGNGILSPTQAAGREAARNISAGVPVRAADVVVPRLVRRGEPVTIAFRSGGLSITTSGRALTSGGAGEFVRVVTGTNRTLDAVVEGSSAVAIQ